MITFPCQINSLILYIGVSLIWNRNYVNWTANSGNLINHWSTNWRQLKDLVSQMRLKWHCASVLVYRTRSGRVEPFHYYENISLKSVKNTVGTQLILRRNHSRHVTLHFQVECFSFPILSRSTDALALREVYETFMDPMSDYLLYQDRKPNSIRWNDLISLETKLQNKSSIISK